MITDQLVDGIGLQPSNSQYTQNTWIYVASTTMQLNNVLLLIQKRVALFYLSVCFILSPLFYGRMILKLSNKRQYPASVKLMGVLPLI